MIFLNPWEYTDIEFTDQLAYLTIACTTRCNFACPYCSKQSAGIRDLDYQLLIRLLDEAVALGLRKVELTGGEALLYPFFWEVVGWLRNHDITVNLVTNGATIDRKSAADLARYRVNVAVSLSTLREERFHELSGGRGRLSRVIEALDFLLTAGHAATTPPLVAVHALGSREVFPELAEIRAFSRNRGCGFVLNRAIPTGGLQADNLPALKDLKRFLDRESATGSATIPFCGNTPCNRLKAGCYIGTDGLVRPCASIDRVAGDPRTESLADIWMQSELLTVCRNLEAHLEGSCGACPERLRCYGCRAVAYAAYGSVTATDPGCFRFGEGFYENRGPQQEGTDR